MYQPQGIQGFSRLFLEYLGSESDGKFRNLHPGTLGRQEMAQFMDRDQYAKQDNGR